MYVLRGRGLCRRRSRWLVGAVSAAVLATPLQVAIPTAQAQQPIQEPVIEVVLPARIEAENFDSGGAGVAYEDIDAENFGEVRPADSVDTYRRPRTGASGGDLIGRTRDGEWLEYTVEVEAATEFEVLVTVASASSTAGTVAIEVDGNPVGAVAGATNKWFDWTTRSAGEVTLAAGTHVVRMSFADGAAANVDRIDFVSLEIMEPTCATDRRQAELATLGGRFVSVADPDASGLGYVTVPKGLGGRFGGVSDDFVEFCVGVADRGVYEIETTLRTPSAQDNSFFVAVDDGELVDFVADVTGDVFANDRVNDSPSLDQLGKRDADGPTIDAMTYDLEAGDHSIRFYVRRDGAQLDSILLVRVGDLSPLPLEPLGGDPLRLWEGTGPTIELVAGETATFATTFACFKCFSPEDLVDTYAAVGEVEGLVQFTSVSSAGSNGGDERWSVSWTVTAPPAGLDTPARQVLTGTLNAIDSLNGRTEGALPVRLVVTAP